MGRKANWTEKPKSGPGRKARKQPDPSFPGMSVAGKSPGAVKKRYGKNKVGPRNNKKRTVSYGSEQLKPGLPFKKANFVKSQESRGGKSNGTLFVNAYMCDKVTSYHSCKNEN